MSSTPLSYVLPQKRPGGYHSRQNSGSSIDSKRSWRSEVSKSSPSSSRPTSPISSSPPKNNNFSSPAKWARGSRLHENTQPENLERGRVYYLASSALDCRHLNYWAEKRKHRGFIDHPVIVTHIVEGSAGKQIAFFKVCTSNKDRKNFGFYEIGKPGDPPGPTILNLTPETKDRLPKTSYVDHKCDNIWAVDASFIKPFSPAKKQLSIKLTKKSVQTLDDCCQRSEMIAEMKRMTGGI